MQHQVNLRGTKKHHDTIRDMMATSSHVIFLSVAGIPNGYMAVGYLLFLQEQIKDIINFVFYKRSISHTHTHTHTEYALVI